jgi:hypothetical protein
MYNCHLRICESELSGCVDPYLVLLSIVSDVFCLGALMGELYGSADSNLEIYSGDWNKKLKLTYFMIRGALVGEVNACVNQLARYHWYNFHCLPNYSLNYR